MQRKHESPIFLRISGSNYYLLRAHANFALARARARRLSGICARDRADRRTRPRLPKILSADRRTRPRRRRRPKILSAEQTVRRRRNILSARRRRRRAESADRRGWIGMWRDSVDPLDCNRVQPRRMARSGGRDDDTRSEPRRRAIEAGGEASGRRSEDGAGGDASMMHRRSRRCLRHRHSCSTPPQLSVRFASRFANQKLIQESMAKRAES